jgi:hypothetical protein
MNVIPVLRDWHRLRVFQSTVPTRIFEYKRQEVRGDRKKLLEEIRDVYSRNIRVIKSRIMRWVGHVARMGQKRTGYRDLVTKPQGKKSLGRRRR